METRIGGKRSPRALGRGVAVLAAAVCGLACAHACAARADGPLPAPAFGAEFWRAWGDGQAEIDGYALARTRYGEHRTGRVVAVFVTEPWSKRDHVKADPPRPDGPQRTPDDVMQVLKLNQLEQFQTGIYDYRLMTSAWVALDDAPGRPRGSAARVTFSSQEWCGAMWSELVFDARGAHESVRSYFDGETGTRTLPPAAGLAEDLLLVWARGLASPVLAPGEVREVPFLPAQAHARLQHTPTVWQRARLRRTREVLDISVPAGRIASERVVVEVLADHARPARQIELFVEVAPPRRVTRMVASDGTTLSLTGSLRTPYWQKNHEGDERLLQQLGLSPP